MRTLETPRPIEDINHVENLSAPELRLKAFHTIETLKAGIGNSIVASQSDVEGLAAMVATGTGLLESTPGKGKTTVAKGIARIIGGQFMRTQGTPELVPSDIIGIEYFGRTDEEMMFRPGPILESNVYLADELNRATGKTQSALLEAMAEGQVTVGGQTYELKDPFTMIATQNPYVHGETHELPLGELDRFAVSLKMQPTRDEKKQIMQRHAKGGGLNENLVSLSDVRALRKAMTKVEIPDQVYEYILDIEEGVENHGYVDGRSSIIDGRARLFMMNVAQYIALSRTKGVATVRMEDAYVAAQFVLPHRIGLDFDAQDKHAEVLAKAKENGTLHKVSSDPVMHVIHNAIDRTV